MEFGLGLALSRRSCEWLPYYGPGPTTVVSGESHGASMAEQVHDAGCHLTNNSVTDELGLLKGHNDGCNEL
jgi:hypothetical protein